MAKKKGTPEEIAEARRLRAEREAQHERTMRLLAERIEHYDRIIEEKQRAAG